MVKCSFLKKKNTVNIPILFPYEPLKLQLYLYFNMSSSR